ncbi:spondin domain-containing protein [uncultured Roseibium sp.]|uniref:spondin domain-containing protein n=1 Tax=uncultured Roseibium sp. TaxID=1936171 RepID=UPI00262476F3|nr:spondin domain-containing protein [uncultured Roseibium sp.]
MRKLTTLLGASVMGLLIAGTANATTVDITFNNSNGFGFLVTPVYTGIHSGNFDAFNEGASASAGIEQVAEVPVPPNPPNLIAPERLAADPGSQGGFIFGPGGPILDGQSGTLTIDVANPTTNRYATFLSMFVPSNDTFFGNDNPFAYEIFDSAGNLIEQTIEITGRSIWDAGTEVNQLFGAAAPGQDIQLGDTEGGVITRLIDIDAGLDGNGFGALGALFGIADAGSITSDTVLFTIDIEATPTPVPLPAGGALLLGSLGVMGFVARKRAKKA